MTTLTRWNGTGSTDDGADFASVVPE